MSTRNKARKSTGTRASQSTRTSDGNNSSNQVQTRRALFNSNNTTTNSQNSSAQLSRSPSPDSDIPTQPLRLRNRNTTANTQATPGPSGTSSRARGSRRISTDSDFDENTSSQRLSNKRRQKARIQREQSSSDTTSDSDAPGHEKIEENNAAKNKKKKLTKPTPAETKTKKKTKKKQSSTSESDTSEEEPLPRTLNASQSRNIPGLVNKCVYFLLIADQKKYAIKRQDIMKHVFCQQDQKLYNVVIEEANEKLKKTYGLEIILNEKRKGEYLLINYLDRDLSVHEFIELSPTELQKRGLIFYLLTVIYMNENSISEEELYTALKPLGVDVSARNPHPIFGDVRKYLTSELVKQMYLEYKCISKDPPQFEFSWGIRAKQEVDKKDLLEFTCQVIKETKPEDWILQHKDAVDSAKHRAESNKKK